MKPKPETFSTLPSLSNVTVNEMPAGTQCERKTNHTTNGESATTPHRNGDLFRARQASATPGGSDNHRAHSRDARNEEQSDERPDPLTLRNRCCSHSRGHEADNDDRLGP